MSFLEELSKKGIIQESQIGEIKIRARDKFAGDLDAALLELGLSEDQLLEEKGIYLKIPTKKVDLKDMSFEDRKSVV